MKLHLGAGNIRFYGWFNLDLQRGHDLRRGLPGWSDDSVQAVYACHVLEHLSYDAGAGLLAEVYRVLAPGSVARFGVPDFRLFAEAYVAGDERFLRAYCERYLAAVPDDPHHPDASTARLGRFGPVAALLAVTHGWGHCAIYDEPVLRCALAAAGFPAAGIMRCKFGESAYFPQCELDRNFDDHSLFMEAAKPSADGALPAFVGLTGEQG